ncbi:MAG: transposase [Acidobacteriota bacterium]|nr:transposase [Acidobacteriota bacterium]
MPRAFYRRNLPHLQCDDKPHFLTFCTYSRRTLPNWARSIVLDACVRAHKWTIDLRAVIVMPDHIHMIFFPRIDRERLGVYSLARITKAIKSTSAHRINQQLGRSGRVWQEESFDRVLRISEKLDEKVEYILNNPVRKELVKLTDQYPWLWVPEMQVVEPPFCTELGR